MSLDVDLTYAEMMRQAELKNTSLSLAKVNERYFQRRLAAQQNNSGTLDDALDALHGFGNNTGLPLDDTAHGSTKATFESALATLVADGASPTQAHVTAARDAYNAYVKHLFARVYVAADKASHESALATLVADGASPTQAHVTALNNAYTTLKAGVI